MRTWEIGLLLGMVFLFISALPLRAQDETVPLSKGDIRFTVDHAGFRDSSGRVREIFTCRFGYDQLHFTRQNGRYLASMELTAIVYDRKGNQLVGDNWDKTYEAKDYSATVASGKPVVESFSFLLDPGTYRLRVELADPAADSKGVWQEDVAVPKLSLDQTQLSEFVFLTAPLAASQESLSLDSGRLNPSRVYDDSAPTVRWFFTVYGPVTVGAKLLFGVMDARGKTWVAGTRALQELAVSSSQRLQDSLSLTSLVGGTYLLTITMRDSSGKILAHQEARFDYVPFYAPLAHSYNEALEVLGYIASSVELDSLRKASPSSRRAAWEAFWRRRDPSSGTDRNEAREQFSERVAYANANFSRFSKGWKTDRGRVYITLGSPDDVERHPFDADFPSYEIWYYNSLNRQFLFVDRHGLGDYVLSNWADLIKR